MCDCRAVVTTVTGECQGAVIGVCICLWNELQQVVKKDIPEERAENTTLWYTGMDGMFVRCLPVHDHSEESALQVVLEQVEQMTADTQAV